MLCYTSAFVFAVAGLWNGKPRWDALTTGAIEVGAVLNALLFVVIGLHIAIVPGTGLLPTAIIATCSQMPRSSAPMKPV